MSDEGVDPIFANVLSTIFDPTEPRQAEKLSLVAGNRPQDSCFPL